MALFHAAVHHGRHAGNRRADRAVIDQAAGILGGGSENRVRGNAKPDIPVAGGPVDPDGAIERRRHRLFRKDVLAGLNGVERDLCMRGWNGQVENEVDLIRAHHVINLKRAQIEPRCKASRGLGPKVGNGHDRKIPKQPGVLEIGFGNIAAADDTDAQHRVPPSEFGAL